MHSIQLGHRKILMDLDGRSNIILGKFYFCSDCLCRSLWAKYGKAAISMR